MGGLGKPFSDLLLALGRQHDVLDSDVMISLKEKGVGHPLTISKEANAYHISMFSREDVDETSRAGSHVSLSQNATDQLSSSDDDG